MAQNPKKLIPGAEIIYERVDDVVYARYRNPPHNKEPRWIVGGTAAGVARANGFCLSYNEWMVLCELSEQYPTLKAQLKKLFDIYNLVKDSHKEKS